MICGEIALTVVPQVIRFEESQERFSVDTYHSALGLSYWHESNPVEKTV